MEITGEQLIPLPQAEVWRGLNDPEVLKACIAGCEAIERVSDTEYRVVMVASVGPVKAKCPPCLVGGRCTVPGVSRVPRAPARALISRHPFTVTRALA